MAGTVTETSSPGAAYRKPTDQINRVVVSWTSHTDGTADGTVNGINGTILRVVTNPGAAAPTDGYDVTLTDEDGIDVLAGLGADRDTANSENIVPLDVTSGLPFVVAGALTLSVTNAGSQKNGTVSIYFR